jgi:hypothetical protein
MIDPKYLFLGEVAVQEIVQLARGFQIMPERLLDDDASPDVGLLRRCDGRRQGAGLSRPALAEMCDDVIECFRRGREIVKPISTGVELPIELVKRIFEPLEIVG